MISAGEAVFAGVELCDANRLYHEAEELFLILIWERLEGLAEVPEPLRDGFVIGHDALAKLNVGLHLFALDIQGALFFRELSGFGHHFLAEALVVRTGEIEIATQSVVHRVELLGQLRKLGFEWTEGLLLGGIRGGEGGLDHLGVVAELANEVDDDLFKRPGRHVAQWATRMRSVPTDITTDIVEIHATLRVLFAARMRREQIAAVATAGDAFEQSMVTISFADGRQFLFQVTKRKVSLIP